MNAATGQFHSVFTTEELKNLNTILDKLPDMLLKTPDVTFGHTNGFKINDIVYPSIKKLVIQRVESLLGKKIQLHVGMILKSVAPFPIHSDYKKNDLDPDLAILIPLNSTTLDTHTILFNETCLDDFDLYLSRANKLDSNATTLYKTLCSHETEYRLERVSVKGIYKWTPGSVIYWDRKLLHCSDNYLNRNITEKRALILFTTNDKLE